jgi:hypothetical protein
MKQTAVEWLYSFMLKPLSQWPDDMWDQAKAMEKEQLKNVWLDGRNSRTNGQDPMDQIKNL